MTILTNPIRAPREPDWEAIKGMTAHEWAIPMGGQVALVVESEENEDE